MRCRAVLFDLDGTLLDTLKDIANSVNKALLHLGFPRHELEAYKHFVGDGREILAIRTLPEHHRDPATVIKLAASINEEYLKHWGDSTCCYQGIPELLNALTIGNIKMAILSNKPHSFTEIMVPRLLSRWHFEIVVGALSSVPKKPDPTAALQISQRLDIPPSEFIYLGDSDIDMKTATAANMYPIGALWGYRTAEELLAGGAQKLIDHPTDLLRLL
jgi:phosphoglycolate phosphatase